MTTIRLKPETVYNFLGSSSNEYRGCYEICSISCHDATPGKAKVEAQIPAASTRQKIYNINVSLESDGSMIHHAWCSCPISRCCKHINKVLERIIDSQNNPLPEPYPPISVREAEQRRRAEMMDHASVYIAIACQSELDSGSDFLQSQFIKDNVDQEILGVFFSKRLANKCAKERAYEEGYEDDDDDDDNNDDDDYEEDDVNENEDDDESFVYDGSDTGNYDGHMFTKVWVERRVIEDALTYFMR